MNIATSKPKASQFAVGGKRATDIIGKTYGDFVVEAYVGTDASSLYVALRHKCGGTIKRRRDELHRVAKQPFCSNCCNGQRVHAEVTQCSTVS